MMRLAAFLAFLHLESVSSMRVSESVSANETEIDFGRRCPLMPYGVVAIQTGSGACKQSVHKTLVVHVKHANGLFKGHWNDLSDPYTRLRFSDSARVHKEGAFHRFKNYVAKSDAVKTKVIHNEQAPKWNEVFTFNFMCPERPSNFQLEIKLADRDKLNRDDDLGWAYIPLGKLLDTPPKGEQAYPLTTNIADNGDKRAKTEGATVTLSFNWCGYGNTDCISRASKGAPISGHINLDCDQSCHKALGPALERPVQAVINDLNVAIGQNANADHYDAQGDFHDDVGDHMKHEAVGTSMTGGHVSQQEIHQIHKHQELENHYDHLEDQAEAAAQAAWNRAVAKIRSLPSSLRAAGQTACGVTMAGEAGMNLDNLRLPRKFKIVRAKKLRSRFYGLKKRIQAGVSCLASEWAAGNTLTRVGSVSATCQAHFSR